MLLDLSAEPHLFSATADPRRFPLAAFHHSRQGSYSSSLQDAVPLRQHLLRALPPLVQRSLPFRQDTVLAAVARLDGS